MDHYENWPLYPTDILDATGYPDQTDNVNYIWAWLVNALKEEMIAVQEELGTLPKGDYASVKARLDALGPPFTDRGDPAAVDFDLGDLTTDATWRELDLSSIVPAGTKTVLFRATVIDNSGNNHITFRKVGNSNEIAVCILCSQLANVHNHRNCILPLTSSRIIEYNADNVTWTSIEITVAGWW